METTTLIGDDATIEELTFGTEKIGDATKTFDVHVGGSAGSGKGPWLITALATTGSIFAGLAVGDLFLADGDEIPAVGDKMKQASASEIMDASSFSISFSKKEVEVTLLRHKITKFRAGRSDADGTLKGIFTLGVTGEAGGLLNQFLKIVKKSALGVVTVSEVNSHPIYIRGVVRDTTTSGETYAFIFGQIELFGVALGAESGNKQEYSSKFRFTGNDPIYYEEEIA